MNRKLAGLLAMTALIIPAWGCGGAAHDLDDAAVKEHLAKHEHATDSSVSSSSISSEEQPGGGVCYCYTCAKHHPPECL